MNSSVFVTFLIILSCNFQVAQAASFDCGKASSRIEKLICANEHLSKLDRSLSKLYNSRKKNNPSLINEQKQWLLKVRNPCQTSACLITVYSSRIKALHVLDNCQITENALLGNWTEYKGEGTFEEVQFSNANEVRQFTSWRHHHLEMIGLWKLEQCVIHVVHPSEVALRYSLKIKKLKNNKLYVFDVGSQSEVVYKFAS